MHACIHTYRQTHTQTDRLFGRQTDGQTDIHTYLHTYMHTYRHTYIHTNIHTYIHTEKCKTKVTRKRTSTAPVMQVIIIFVRADLRSRTLCILSCPLATRVDLSCLKRMSLCWFDAYTCPQSHTTAPGVQAFIIVLCILLCTIHYTLYTIYTHHIRI